MFFHVASDLIFGVNIVWCERAGDQIDQMRDRLPSNEVCLSTGRLTGGLRVGLEGHWLLWLLIVSARGHCLVFCHLPSCDILVTVWVPQKGGRHRRHLFQGFWQGKAWVLHSAVMLRVLLGVLINPEQVRCDKNIAIFCCSADDPFCMLGVEFAEGIVQHELFHCLTSRLLENFIWKLRKKCVGCVVDSPCCTTDWRWDKNTSWRFMDKAAQRGKITVNQVLYLSSSCDVLRSHPSNSRTTYKNGTFIPYIRLLKTIYGTDFAGSEFGNYVEPTFLRPSSGQHVSISREAT